MHYKKHIFFCTNQKAPGKRCCANHDAAQAVEYMKEQLKAKGLHGPGKIRVSSAGCLGRCSVGPCVVVYPEGVWYRYENRQDLDTIISEHIEQDRRVDSLMIDSPESV